MDFELPSETLMLRDMLRRFVEKEARPREAEYFTTGKLSPNQRNRLRAAIEQMGLWGVTVPERYGGMGVDLITSCVIEEELGKTFLPVPIGDVPANLYGCDPEQAERYLKPTVSGKRRAFIAMLEPAAPHPVRTFRPATWKTIAHPADDGYILGGRKLISGIPDPEDFYLVFARSPQGISTFLLDAAHEGSSLRLEPEICLHLDGCRVGAEALLGRLGEGLAAGAALAPRAWVRVAARSVGIANRLLEMSAEHASNWFSFDAKLSTRPAVQRMLADLQVQIESTRWLVYHAAWIADQGKDFYTPAARARIATAQLLRQADASTILIYGGPGPHSNESWTAQKRITEEIMNIGLEIARGAVANEILSPHNSG